MDAACVEECVVFEAELRRRQQLHEAARAAEDLEIQGNAKRSQL